MNKPILPATASDAIATMIDITRNMRLIVERENAALRDREGDALKTAIDQKADLAFMYEDASREFKQRLEEFRGISRQSLDELEKEQKILKAVETENRIFYNAVQGKAG